MPELERENVIATLAGNVSLRLGLDELLAKPDPLVAELYVRLLLATNQRERVREFLTLNGEYRASVLIEVGSLTAISLSQGRELFVALIERSVKGNRCG